MIAVVAQARMSSTRLPGKSLRKLDGERTTLQLHVERLQRAERADLVVVATSTDPSDDAIAEHDLGVEVLRGPLHDVAKRYAMAVERFGLDAFVRTSADSPLLDQALIDRAIELYEEGGAEIVSNVQPRSYARGQSVEVVDARAFLAADPDPEHVTSTLYGPLRHRHFGQDRDDSHVNLSIDTEDDARLVEAILARMERPHWEYRYEEVMELYREVTA